MDVVIPGYKIVKVIGKGGMATVYVAVQESFNRQVALKIMARHLTGDEVFSERFFREARIIASLNHRNIVPVFDVGKAGEHHYLSMEYLPGGDLKQRLKQGIRAEDALHVIYEIATALAYAHSKSYIHRDIKPENILFREDSTVVLTDFGIAKALDTSDCNMTSTGMIVGSPHYMSPEQALAREIDPRSDIYSLGVVFYEVLVGKPLYDANSSVAAAIKHISEPIPQLPETFAYLQPLLEKMVAKAPEDRFQSALEVAQALEPYLRTAPENWKTVVQDEFVSETEGGTRIMVRSTGQHHVSATPAPMPGGDYAAAPTLYGDSVSAVTSEPRTGAGVGHLWSRLNRDRKKLGAVAVSLVALVGIVAVMTNQEEGAVPAHTQLVVEELPEPVQAEAIDEMPEAIRTEEPVVISEPAEALENEALVQTAPILEMSPEEPLMQEPPAQQASQPEEKTGVQLIATAEAGQDQQLALLESPDVEEDNIELTAEPEQLTQADPLVTPDIDRLLAQAKEALRRDRLMLPRETSAYTLYQKVLEWEPSNEVAKQGLDRIVGKYLTLSSRELNAGELEQAQEYVDRAQTVAALDIISPTTKQEVVTMQTAIERVRYLDTMEKLETWIAILKQKQNLSRDDLNKAYESYMAVLNNDYRDPKVEVANEIYANAFFDLGKRFFKADDLEVSRELIAKGLEINPDHEKLQDLSARWERKKNGNEWFMDRFY